MKKRIDSDLDITGLDIEFLKDLIKKNKDDNDSPLIRLAMIMLKLSRKSLK